MFQRNELPYVFLSVLQINFCYFFILLIYQTYHLWIWCFHVSQHEKDFEFIMFFYYSVIIPYKFMNGRYPTWKWFVYFPHNSKDIRNRVKFWLVEEMEGGGRGKGGAGTSLSPSRENPVGGHFSGPVGGGGLLFHMGNKGTSSYRGSHN